MNLRKISMAAALVGAMAFGSMAQADVIVNMTFDHYDPTTSPSANVTHDGITDAHRAGQLIFTINSVTGDSPVNFGSTLGAFCVELDVPLPTSPTDYTLMSASSYGFSQTQIDAIRSLYAGYGDMLNSTPGSYENAAFQLAIWEIVYDTNMDLVTQTGDFYANSPFGSARALAQTWLDSLGSIDPTGALFVLYSPTTQDVTFLVPEPGTLALMGAGLLAFGAIRRRRKSQNS